MHTKAFSHYRCVIVVTKIVITVLPNCYLNLAYTLTSFLINARYPPRSGLWCFVRKLVACFLRWDFSTAVGFFSCSTRPSQYNWLQPYRRLAFAPSLLIRLLYLYRAPLRMVAICNLELLNVLSRIYFDKNPVTVTAANNINCCIYP